MHCQLSLRSPGMFQEKVLENHSYYRYHPNCSEEPFRGVYDYEEENKNALYHENPRRARILKSFSQAPFRFQNPT